MTATFPTLSIAHTGENRWGSKFNPFFQPGPLKGWKEKPPDSGDVSNPSNPSKGVSAKGPKIDPPPLLTPAWVGKGMCGWSP